jgi:cell division protein ZipA
MAPRNTFFYGRDMVQDLERFGLSYGRHGIYHYVNPNGETEFSVALAVEPGYFDLENIDSVTTPGVIFFMDLHQNSEPKQAFKRMLSTVHEVASHLGGDILDHRRQRLTQASVTEYLARIKGFDNYRKAMNG